MKGMRMNRHCYTDVITFELVSYSYQIEVCQTLYKEITTGQTADSIACYTQKIFYTVDFTGASAAPGAPFNLSGISLLRNIPNSLTRLGGQRRIVPK
jgi:hypothetical protein